LKLRLTQLPSGWLHGRVSDPSISIIKNSGSFDLSIVANPIAVPIVYKMYNYQEMPAALKAMYSAKTGAFINDPNYLRDPNNYWPGGRSAPNSDPLQRNVIINPDPWSTSGMEQLKLWLPFVNDQATALMSAWSIRTLSTNEAAGSNQCFADPSSITGIVTTNSTQYSSGPPIFDKGLGSLNYSVAAPHFTTNHEVFKGSYDLLMRSDVARCVYGFSKAPIKASVSVISADGTPQTATTVVSESNGWVHLAANGFEFSNPSIQVKMNQDAPTTNNPSPATSPLPSTSPSTNTTVPIPKKTTITCIKGSSIKKVTAVKPACPTGYRKK
jgi:hypothetical protein